MRFFADGPSIPDVLLERRDAGRVVFLCGAGVSFNSGMPTFLGLAQHVVEFFDPPADSQIMKAFAPWLEDPSAPNVPLDQIFNLLHQEYGKDDVNALVTERLRVPAKAASVGHEHRLIKRISSDQSGSPQIVTTNFDLLFEDPSGADNITTHVPPAFPDIAYGATVSGITYLHGRLAPAGALHHPYVLSSADFGRAYLSEAWATRFIRSLLDRYTAVLVGYQAEDPPVKYLLQGLNHDGKFDRTRLYAFDKGLPEAIEAKWRDRGVTAIAYSDHQQLWDTMEAWADRADDARAWRRATVSIAENDPKKLASHQRGQVAHVLRSAPGTKLFADIDPIPHPEWICVLDAFSRSAEKSSGYGPDAEVFKPILAYGLDDDLPSISDEEWRQGIRNDDLLGWRHGDNIPADGFRLGSPPPAERAPIPVRLWHLVRWIGKSMASPVIAWWAARQVGLHPRLLEQFEWHLRRDGKELQPQARNIWNLILEHHRDPRNREWDGGWFDLKRRLEQEGWTASVLRDFERAATPRLEIKPSLGLPRSKPPSTDWADLTLSDIAQFEIKLMERFDDKLNIPDAALEEALSILERQLKIASGMMSDLGVTYFITPTCYPDREVDGDEYHTGAAKVVPLFIEIFNKLSKLRPDLARSHGMQWDIGDKYFFRKLKLYALSMPTLFAPSEAADVIASTNQDSLWDPKVVRELLFLIVDRWSEFSNSAKKQMLQRLMKGPDQMPHWSDDEYKTWRYEFVARYVRYLELQGCELPQPYAQRLAKIIDGIPDWSDEWATSIASERGASGGWVRTDETPDAILDLPVNEVVGRAKEDSFRDFGSLTERRPFTGLVKANPRKALSSLTVAAKAGEYPQAFWTALINEWPEDVPSRLFRVLLCRLVRLPDVAVVELRHTLGRWLEEKLPAILEFDSDLGWSVFDHVVNSLLSGGEEAAESGIGEIRQGGEVVERSRRTLDHAINGPFGMCTDALLAALRATEPVENSGLPEEIRARLERLFAAQGEGADHTTAICMRYLSWLMYIDPSWTNTHLIPLFAFDHPSSEPAWNGLLNSGGNPSTQLAAVLKPLFLELYPWVEEFHWRDIVGRPAQWMAWSTIFRQEEPDGLTPGQMRNVLRAMSEESRNDVIFWLGRVGQGNDDGWSGLVIPFIEQVWPRERRFRTSTSVRAWLNLLDDTEGHFPSVYAAVKKFLVPIEDDSLPFYRFMRDVGDDEPITVRHPETALDLMNTITPLVLSRPSYDLSQILSLIAETEPRLTADGRYVRLIDLLERS
jgi:hypothetical protein